MSKIKENTTEVGFKVKKNKFKLNHKYNQKDDKFYCNECDYESECLTRMKAHLISHSTVRPFECKHEGCGQAFKRHNSLKRHIKTLHLNERLYCCTICQKKFSQSQSLNDHVFIHLDNKSFRCVVEGCTKSFQTPKSLKAHQNRRHLSLIMGMSPQNSHTFNESFESMKMEAQEELNAIIAQKTSLGTNTSIQNVCPYELFRCAVKGCGQSFRLQRSLRSHYKFTHSEYYNKKTKSIELSSDSAPDVTNVDITDTKVKSKSGPIETIVLVDGNSDTNSQHSLTTSSDNSIIDKICGNTYVFECNFAKCLYKTKSFERIAEHFSTHWQQINV